jgi:hypothetical protein
MILIAFSWIILFCFFLTYGITIENLLRINSNKITFTILFGMVIQTVLLTICAFFNAIGLAVFIGNFFLLTILTIQYRKEIVIKINLFLSDFKSLSNYLKIILLIILVSAILKSAQSPFILDNESYYIQTIKWLNEYGFVKGIANLNIAFGSTSAWHILQSGFNFSFVTDRINDINGFLFVICSYYFISEFDKNWKQHQQFHWIGFVFIFNVLTYQFINSPSPDLPLFLIAQLLFYLFLKTTKTIDNQKIIILLFVYLVFLKITIAPLSFLLLYQYYQEKKTRIFLLITVFIFTVLWMAKNTILTGYPLFSMIFIHFSCDWIVPEKLVNVFNYSIKNHEFTSVSNFKNLSVLEKFYIWVQFGGINRIFNVGILLLFLVAPFTKMIRTFFEYKVMYLLLLIHFVVVFLLSPQFRFFLAEFIFLTVLVFSDILNKLKVNYQIVKATLFISVMLPVISIYLIDLKSLTKNKHNQEFEKISFSQIFIPEKNSKYSEIEFEKIKEENLDYYSPKDNFFFYGTANGKLPCINKVQIDYLKKKYHFIPQLRTSNLGDGFYSKNISKIEVNE